MLIAFTFAPRN